MAARAVGLAASAHAQLAEPPSRSSLRRPRSRRLHDRRRSGGLHRALRRRLAGTGPHPHGGDHRVAHRHGLSRGNQPGRVRLPLRRHRQRRLQSCQRAVRAGRGAGRHRTDHRVRLSPPRPAARGRRARRRPVRHRAAARRGNPPVRPSRHAVGRRARAPAPPVSRPRRAVVDGPLGRVEPALRRDRRPDACAPPAVAAARGHAPARDARSQHARRHGRADRRPACRRCATGARSSRAGCATCSRWPISRWSGCSTRSTPGPVPMGATPTSRRRNGSSRRACRMRRRSSSICATAGSDRSCGPPASGPTTAGCTCRWWTRRAICEHEGGVVASPGMYALGLPVLRRRKSTFIHGAEDDARDVIDHLAGYLAKPASAAARAGL